MGRPGRRNGRGAAAPDTAHPPVCAIRPRTPRPPSSSGRLVRIYYVSQPATHPPLFVFHCNDPDLVQSHYKRFLENVIRAHYDFEGVPLRLEFRPRREREERS